MEKLLVQEFLTTHSFQDLIDQHGVYASLSKNKKKVSLNYDSIETKENDILSYDCRGLILCKTDRSEFATIANKLDLSSVVGETSIISFPLKRFFNYGQGVAANIDFNDPNTVILDKRDGTLTIVHFDLITSQWCVATRSVCEADLLMDNGLFTFRQLFDKALKETTGMEFDQFTSLLDKDITYCFELTTNLNQIVVAYPSNSITLLAARNIKTLQEINVDSLNIANIPNVRLFGRMSVTELVEWVSTFNPLEFEGVVVRDKHFNRIKVKNAQYVVAHHMKSTINASIRNCLEVILLGSDDDITPLLPKEVAENLVLMKRKYVDWLSHEEWKYGEMLKIANDILPNDKKTFALTLQKYNVVFKAAYFSIYDGKSASVKDFIQNNKKFGTWPNSFLDKILDQIKDI